MNSKVGSLETLSDELLMNEYRLGNSLAFEALYSRHRDKVYGYVCSQLASTGSAQTDADEVFQECFLRIHRFRDRYDPTFPFLPWLFTVCRNAMIDFLRHRKRTATEELAVDVAAHDEGPDVSDTLKSLPSQEGLVVSLHYLQGYSFAEVARHLNIQPATARKISSRAIMKLRRLFK